MHSLLDDKIRFCWILCLSGILYSILGSWIITIKEDSLLSYFFIFQLIFYITGILEILYALSNKSIILGWIWILIGGIFNIIFFSLFSIKAIFTLQDLQIYLGFLLLSRSFISIKWIVNLKRTNLESWNNLLILTIWNFTFSGLVLINPKIEQVSFVAYISIALWLWGLTQILLAFGFKKLNKKFGGEPVL